MASTSSINSNSSGSQAPNPPPRTLSRPTQPPPPPPLPSVPPVPPTRDSSIGITAKAAINQHSHQILSTSNVDTQNGVQLLSQFDHLFKPMADLPPPEPFMNKSKSYPSQKSQQQKQTLSQAKIQT